MTRHLFVPALTIALALLAPADSFAQATTTATTTEATATTTAGDDTSAVDSRQRREEFAQLLRSYPPEVGRVLKLDPTLLTNASYLEHYPALAQYLAKHPEVIHSPRFYLESIWIPEEEVPQTAAVRMWSQMIEHITIFATITSVGLIFLWLIRSIVQHRRWTRLSRVQTEVHNKLLDRFTTNEDLLAYIQTPAGKRFLESAPIPLETDPAPIGAPVARILWSVQAGIVLTAAGAGLLLISGRIEKEVAPAMSSLGVIGISIGVGFVISAIVSYVISRRLGLFAPTPEPAAE